MLSQTNNINDIPIEDKAEENLSESLKKNPKQIKIKGIWTGEGILLFCWNPRSATNWVTSDMVPHVHVLVWYTHRGRCVPIWVELPPSCALPPTSRNRFLAGSLGAVLLSMGKIVTPLPSMSAATFSSSQFPWCNPFPSNATSLPGFFALSRPVNVVFTILLLNWKE